MMPPWLYLEWPSVSVEHPGEESPAQHQPAHVDICRLRMVEGPGKWPFAGLSPTVSEHRVPPPRSWSVKMTDLGGPKAPDQRELAPPRPRSHLGN